MDPLCRLLLFQRSRISERFKTCGNVFNECLNKMVSFNRYNHSIISSSKPLVAILLLSAHSEKLLSHEGWLKLVLGEEFVEPFSLGVKAHQ